MNVQIVPISEFHLNQSKVLSMVGQAPVFLTQRSKPAAVMVSVDEWNRITTQLRNHELLQLARERRAQMENDPSQVVTDEELTRQIAAKVAG